MPVNFLLIESIRRFHSYYGDDFQVECPTGSGNMLTLREVADELSHRLARLFQAIRLCFMFRLFGFDDRVFS